MLKNLKFPLPYSNSIIIFFFLKTTAVIRNKICAWEPGTEYEFAEIHLEHLRSLYSNSKLLKL